MRNFTFMLVVIEIGVSSAAPGLWEQCRLKNDTEIACDKGLVCVPDVEYYGLCYTEVVEESGQCGGLGWNVSCVNGTICIRQNKGWASCESTGKVTYPAAEWQQCDPQDNDNVCADGLICVDDNDYHGMCIKEVAELWGQCGGSGWVTDCDIGSRCEVKTVTYSQCVPNDSQSEKSASVGGSPEAGLVVFLDMSSLLKPIVQLKELATTVKEFPCSMRKTVFPETNCIDDEEPESST